MAINVILMVFNGETAVGMEELYHCFKSNDKINVTLLGIPMLDRLKSTLRHTSAKCITELWSEKNLEFVTYESGDLKFLNPDFVFYGTPYHGYIPPELQIDKVQKYAKICYFGYGYECWHCRKYKHLVIDFLRKADMFFVENKIYYNEFMQHIKNEKPEFRFKEKTYITGHPKVNSIKYQPEMNYTSFGWSPRWAPADSGFYDYKDFLTNHFQNDKDINLNVKYHPMMDIEWRKAFEKNIVNDENITIYREIYYTKYFETIDVLICDVSSFISEFFPTGKPVVFCFKPHYELGDFLKEQLKTCYVVKNTNELKKVLIDLKNKIDPLKENRLKFIEEHYSCYKPAQNVADELIKYANNNPDFKKI